VSDGGGTVERAAVGIVLKDFGVPSPAMVGRLLDVARDRWRRRVDRNKVEKVVFRFSEKRYKNPHFLLARTVVSTRIGLFMGQGGHEPKMGLIGASPCSADHDGRSAKARPQWAPFSSGRQVGPGMF
jgi:hypothetical protein